MIDNILHIYRDFYYSLPQSLVTFFGSVYGSVPLRIRFGSTYEFHSQLARQFEEWDEQLQQDYIFNKTLETLLFAERHIPYYQTTFAQHGFRSADFKSPSDIKNVPSITKEAIKNNLKSLYTFKRQRGTAYFTGGSTSVPMCFYLPLRTSRGKEKAYINYILSKLGYQPRDKTIILKGRTIVNTRQDRYWQYEPVDNHLVLSSNHLNQDHILPILDKVRGFRPKYFYGYPSAIMDFIKSAKAQGCHGLSKINGIFLGSEHVFREQIVEIQEFFQCDVITIFGHSERSAIAYRRSTGGYDFLNSYGMVRSVDNQIVSTSFDNFVMPLINYEQQDYVSTSNETYDDSDILLSAKDIEGRIQEFLVTKNKRLISICTMGAGHFSTLQEVEAIQYAQREPGKASLRIMVAEGKFCDLDAIRMELERQAGHAITFTVEVVDHIEKTSQGKRVLCVQEIDLSKN